MKKRKNSRKYRIRAAIVAAAAAAALTAATGSYAAYTHLGFVKGVIATQGKSGLAFSSNYLNAYDSGADTSQYGTRLIAFGGTDNPSFTVSVCNYPQGDLSNINETNISYLFRATLVDVNGNNITSLTDLSGYSVAVSSQTVSFTKTDTAIVCEIDSRTLQGGAENGDRHIYTISMGTEPDQNIYVRLEAIPSDDASQQAAGGKKLARILGFTDAASAGASTSWSGTFTKDADTPGALSAFNYELTGSGSGKVTLTWDTRYVEIDPFFLQKYDLTPSENGDKKSVTIAVNSNVQPDYRVSFYRTQTPSSGEEWTVANNSYNIKCSNTTYVTYSFAADA